MANGASILGAGQGDDAFYYFTFATIELGSLLDSFVREVALSVRCRISFSFGSFGTK